MAVGIGYVLIRPVKDKRRKIKSLDEMLDKDRDYQGVIVEVGGSDGLFNIDPNCKPGVTALMPVSTKQLFTIEGVDHYICHHTEIKYFYDTK